MELTNDQLVEFWITMNKIRGFENKVADYFAEGLIPGFVHLSVGQEAVAVGVCSNLSGEDYLATNHRGHGHMIVKGGDIKFMMAEIFGKKTGYCKGKGGSMHIADLDLGIMGANGIVGGGPPLAAGAALACQYLENNAVAVCIFGDAASNQGTCHEAMNLASCWKLPVVFVAENNMYGISACSLDNCSVSNIADRANAYDMPGVMVDGNDVIAVYEATAEAVTRAREGNGPSLIECKTYRHRGHFEGDACTYRDEDELADWLKKDPIPRLEKKLVEMGLLTDSKITTYKAKINKELAEARKFTDESPFPEVSELTEDVYS